MTQQDIAAAWRAAQAQEQATFTAWYLVKDVDLEQAKALSKRLLKEQATTQSWLNKLQAISAA